ncbi:capsular biosynthesis protein CpsB [Grimontia sp. AD028]|uniref:outer membrane beta-barrel protein n=1 Tax=Grimontia sp. AD028 TaxID=1581149 RepID=UPI00061AE922|nr:outer membrane beta-barrel protein [Grimontia sp. AD028]KKD58268.1 capsular biosynthesis protein CpsB [Grimontia sp. AD028]
MKSRNLLFCFVGAIPVSALAIEPFPYQTEDGIDIIPTLEINAGHDDNVRRTETNPVGSAMYRISPKVMAQFETRRSAYQLDYTLDAVSFTDSSEDNYVNHNLHGYGFWLFDIRHRLHLDYKYSVTSEARGTGLTEGSSLRVDEPLRFRRHDAYARYVYGAAGAPGRLVGIIGFEAKDYDEEVFVRTNGVTVDTKFYNWDQPYIAGEFYYAVSSYFHAVTVFNHEIRSYDHVFTGPGGTRDSNNTALYGGLDWDVTGKTQGRLLLGFQNKDFKSGQRENFQGFSWKLNLSWKPTDYSEFRLEGLDFARDPNLEADYVKDRSIKIDWEHKWTPLVTTTASARYGTNDYPGIREDDDSQFDVSATYSIARWWDVSAGIGWFERDSTQPGYSYDQTRFFIGMEVSL